MTTLNRSFPDYSPRASDLYFRPVQEGAVRLLCVALTPGGQAILGWVDAATDAFKIAVVPSLQDCYADDIVEPADVRTVWSSGTREIHAGVITVIDGELLAFVSHFRSEVGVEANGKVECYVANDVEDPTSWSLRGTLQNFNVSPPEGTSSFESLVIGPPTVLPSGRWVVPGNTWRNYAGALSDGAGIFTSDDSGATWSIRVNFRNSPLGGGNSGTFTSSVAYHPGTDRLVVGKTSTSVGDDSGATIYYSNDDGSTWSTSDISTAGKGIPHFYIDDTGTLYTVNAVGTVRKIYEAVNPLSASTWVDIGKTVLVIGTLSHHIHGFQSIPLTDGGGNFVAMAFTAGDRLSAFRGGWWVGQVGIG